MANSPETAGFLKSNFPVMVPFHPALTLPQDQFEDFIVRDIKEGIAISRGQDDFPSLALRSSTRKGNDDEGEEAIDEFQTIEEPTDAPEPESESSVWARVTGMEIDPNLTRDDSPSDSEHPQAKQDGPTHPFMDALLSQKSVSDKGQTSRNAENMMRTENGDLAYQTTSSALVDIFFELSDAINPLRARELLDAAWKEDPLITLKMIFNARSIHLGKSSRTSLYLCIDWLSEYHPVTCLLNLRWLCRPVIEKKLAKKEENNKDDDTVWVESGKDDDDLTSFDVRHGVAHGYYKDLLNILVLAINHQLAHPRKILNVEQPNDAKEKIWDAVVAKEKRHKVRDDRHKLAVREFNGFAFYRCLHMTVARIFAAQLATDLSALRSGDKNAMRQISLCAKWAPSSKLLHDKHTFIVSSIAEILHPQSEFTDIEDRELYLRHAREAYRKDVSLLRKALEVVERDISAKKFENIQYEKIPSLAMNRYAMLFATKDEQRFDEYLNKVAGGQVSISGATLLPSTLIHTVRTGGRSVRQARSTRGRTRGRGSVSAMARPKAAEQKLRVVDAQWKTLVQRIRDSGTLDNCIAVCDVSGSMDVQISEDGVTAMDSAIGLSLLVAEVSQPPFNGAFITFSSEPSVERVDLNQSLTEKVRAMERAKWGMNTNFVAVFEKLLLKMALDHGLKQEDMVKRVFVFSDMQFDAALGNSRAWTTSFEGIKASYRIHGYEMPELVFWNLAGARGGRTVGVPPGNLGIAPKPVHAAEEGTSLVSGYSQALLKIFLERGSFADTEGIEDEDAAEAQSQIDEDGDEIMLVDRVAKRQKTDPLVRAKQAVAHKAYSMLKVVD